MLISLSYSLSSLHKGAFPRQKTMIVHLGKLSSPRFSRTCSRSSSACLHQRDRDKRRPTKTCLHNGDPPACSRAYFAQRACARDALSLGERAGPTMRRKSRVKAASLFAAGCSLGVEGFEANFLVAIFPWDAGKRARARQGTE